VTIANHLDIDAVVGSVGALELALAVAAAVGLVREDGPVSQISGHHDTRQVGELGRCEHAVYFTVAYPRFGDT
jgi:hypothetical protein